MADCLVCCFASRGSNSRRSGSAATGPGGSAGVHPRRKRSHVQCGVETKQSCRPVRELSAAHSRRSRRLFSGKSHGLECLSQGALPVPASGQNCAIWKIRVLIAMGSGSWIENYASSGVVMHRCSLLTFSTGCSRLRIRPKALLCVHVNTDNGIFGPFTPPFVNMKKTLFCLCLLASGSLNAIVNRRSD